MNPTSCSSDVSFSCPACQDKNNTQAQFNDRPVDMAVVKTSCQPDPHTYHLGCITRHFENSADERKCVVCSQMPLPLIRADVGRLVEESPYCESRALAICRRGDVAALERLLDEVPEAATVKFRLAQTGEMVSLLSIVANLGHAECAKALVNKGANDPDGTLVQAATEGHARCMKLLAEEGADDLVETLVKGAANVHRRRLLSEKSGDDVIKAQLNAIIDGNGDSLQAALEDGKQDLGFLTACCAYLGDAECMQVLIVNGANPVFSLLTAAHFGQVDAMRVALNHFAESKNVREVTLLLAAGSGNSDSLGCALEGMGEITPSALKNALECASSGGHTECVTLLEETMSRIGDRDYQDETGSESDAPPQDKTISSTDTEAQNETVSEAIVGSSWSCVIV